MVCPLLIQCSSHAIALFCKKLHRTLKQTSFVLLSFHLEGDVTFTHLWEQNPKPLKSKPIGMHRECGSNAGKLFFFKPQFLHL